MRINPFQAVYPDFNYISSTDTFFSTVKEDYPEYKKSGFFQKNAHEALYIYQIATPDRNFTGLIACSDIDDYLSGKIKIHENTLDSKEQKQLNLLVGRKAMVKPVLLTYPEVKSISRLIQQIIKKEECFFSCNVPGEKQKHYIWEVADGQTIQKFQQLFNKDIHIAYIADGHHRSSATALLHKRFRKKKKYRCDQLLTVFFPMTELEIHDYNRVVEALDDCTPTTFMARLSQVFNITPLRKPAKPKAKHELTFWIDKEWYRLTWRKSVLKEYRKKKVLLDATMLDEKVLCDILGVVDVRTDKRLTYVEGPKGLAGFRKELLKTSNRVGFCLYPIDISDIVQIADMRKTMPPKSTWFEPRIKNGMIVAEI